ncbi:MAG: hypothetical protein IPN29_03510 [Saprospiraceae bacterium]|nr:hypothetical protein [Saprospiraceae bacterium]
MKILIIGQNVQRLHNSFICLRYIGYFYFIKVNIIRMDIARIERRVKKINTVLEAFREDNKISSIEKDLLLGYVRELYELIKDSEPDSFELSHPAEPARVAYTPPAAVEPVKAVQTSPPVVEPQPRQEVPAYVPEKPRETIADTPRVVAAEPTPHPEVREEKTAPVHHISEELESIFKMEQISDLSGKLSMTKIDDISKAIGINERIFTITELFGGNNQLFNSTLDKLNNCQSFSEAKAVLIREVAVPMNWEKEDKLRKAQQFVKHVWRKFNA